MLPCGTPCGTSNQLETLPSIDTPCRLPSKYEANHQLADALKPYAPNLSIRISWSTMSKALR